MLFVLIGLLSAVLGNIDEGKGTGVITAGGFGKFMPLYESFLL